MATPAESGAMWAAVTTHTRRILAWELNAHTGGVFDEQDCQKSSTTMSDDSQTNTRGYALTFSVGHLFIVAHVRHDPVLMVFTSDEACRP